MAEAAILGEFLRVPYKHNGRSLAGADCYGIIILWFRMVHGVELFDIATDYPASWEQGGHDYFFENYHRQWEKVAAPGRHDLVLFRKRGMVSHVGIYLKEGKMLHAIRAGCVVSRIDAFAVRETEVEGYYRFRGLNA